jgi:hypothetical protein
MVAGQAIKSSLIVSSFSIPELRFCFSEEMVSGLCTERSHAGPCMLSEARDLPYVRVVAVLEGYFSARDIISTVAQQQTSPNGRFWGSTIRRTDDDGSNKRW